MFIDHSLEFAIFGSIKSFAGEYFFAWWTTDHWGVGWHWFLTDTFVAICDMATWSESCIAIIRLADFTFVFGVDPASCDYFVFLCYLWRFSEVFVRFLKGARFEKIFFFDGYICNNYLPLVWEVELNEDDVPLDISMYALIFWWSPLNDS